MFLDPNTFENTTAFANTTPFTDTNSPAALCAAIQLSDHAASLLPQPMAPAPHGQEHLELKPYAPTEELLDTVGQIISLHRLRQGMIKAQTKLALQGQAVLRLTLQSDSDFESDESKEKARKRTEALYRTVVADVDHPLYPNIRPYLIAMDPLDAQRAAYEKALVKLAKRLPVYAWVKSVKGFGDISFATIVGECGDIGSYKSVSALWKRMGLAVMNGRRQGAPGEGASKEDWIAHGYNKQRRSVSWNARNNIIGGMGKYRPLFGEDVQANEDLTYYQKVFVERARYEMQRFELEIKESDKGKESYNMHSTNRALRYTEKRLLKMLYLNWRRA